MVNYEQDVITVSDGAFVTIKDGDIILQLDATKFLILRKDRKSAR